jgi:hypothetical protein
VGTAILLEIDFLIKAKEAVEKQTSKDGSGAFRRIGFDS